MQTGQTHGNIFRRVLFSGSSTLACKCLDFRYSESIFTLIAQSLRFVLCSCSCSLSTRVTFGGGAVVAVGFVVISFQLPLIGMHSIRFYVCFDENIISAWIRRTPIPLMPISSFYVCAFPLVAIIWWHRGTKQDPRIRVFVYEYTGWADCFYFIIIIQNAFFLLRVSSTNRRQNLLSDPATADCIVANVRVFIFIFLLPKFFRHVLTFLHSVFVFILRVSTLRHGALQHTHAHTPVMFPLRRIEARVWCMHKI